MDEINELSFDNPETCPNCGQHVGHETSCLYCGAILFNEDDMNEFDDNADEF